MALATYGTAMARGVLADSAELDDDGYGVDPCP